MGSLVVGFALYWGLAGEVQRDREATGAKANDGMGLQNVYGRVPGRNT